MKSLLQEIGQRVKLGLAIALLVVASFGLTSCAAAGGGLQQYVDSVKGYEFLYPNGWVPVDVKEASQGVDIVFRDIIQRSENLSLIISDIPEGKTLESLGTPTEVGYRFLKRTKAAASGERSTEFLRAGSYEAKAKPYYILEYALESPGSPKRHNIATVAVSRGKLFTFNLSTDEDRWERVKDEFEKIATSFTVY